MLVHLYLAPAGAGKTAYVLDLARRQAEGLACQPRVVVASHLQARACRARLAAASGSLGVQILTFDRLYAQLLAASGIAAAELSDPVQYRLIRAAVDALPLSHYAPLRERPGFVHVLQRLIEECEAAGASAGALAQAIAAMGSEPRLAELAQICAAYQERLLDNAWADRPGLGRLALDALRAGTAAAGACAWLAVDGFGEFTPVQIGLLAALGASGTDLLVTLTGATVEAAPVYRRFGVTRMALEAALNVAAQPLPAPHGRPARALAHLAGNLFRADPPPPECAEAPIKMVVAADREGEVRAALRWLKERILDDGMSPGQVALLARSVTPYRQFILQTAAEFGLPIRLVSGLPLSRNPAIVALLDLLRLALPASPSDSRPALPRRIVIEAWRSPYFDWSALDEPGDLDVSYGSEPDEERFARYATWLDEAARWGHVVGGPDQWQEVLASLVGRGPGEDGNEDREAPAALPVGSNAQDLSRRFGQFLMLLAPPPAAALRDFVSWLETLIGPDPDEETRRTAGQPGAATLNVVWQARRGPAAVAESDIAALRALKDVLRGLVWAEEAVGEAGPLPIDFPRFVAELAGGVEAAVYHLPAHPGRLEILAGDVRAARGLPMQAVALLGLAEGEFPATLAEDPFLREADRARLRDLGLPFRSATESAEMELFYETIARPAQQLLLTRPRLTEDGAEWQASPFWEEIRRLSNVEPEAQGAGHAPPPVQAASWPELLESLAGLRGQTRALAWAQQTAPDRCSAVEHGARVFRLRTSRAAGSAFDGGLAGHAPLLHRRYAPDRVWSASRLETYVGCPFRFFVSDVLGLEPRQEPDEGLDAAQLGTVFHQIFEAVFADPSVSDPGSLEQLLTALPNAAARVLDAAPAREGFRPTRWWAQTRLEIEGYVRKSLEALAAMPGSYVPIAFEVKFWEPHELVVGTGADSFRVHGVIDRIDRAAGGRLRIIDYKTSGPTDYPENAFIDGKKLQLPLYALAARDALGLGTPVEGFYWHILQARPSKCTLNLTGNGIDDALQAAAATGIAVIAGAREGRFEPKPPDGGCPGYCPAAAFCWHYGGRFGD